jgi:hypothetical protein
VSADDWDLAVEVLRTERELLTDSETSEHSARDEISIRLAAAKAALAKLEAGTQGADRSAITPLQEAYTARIERLEGIEAGAAARDDLTPAFWRAAAMLMAVERETLAAWSAENLVDASVADLAERDLAAEAADLAVATASP